MLELLAEGPLTREGLAAEVCRRFGAEVRFCTCSAQGLTREALVELLIGKGKIVEVEGMLTVDRARICKHG